MTLFPRSRGYTFALAGVILIAVIALAGCTVSDASGRFERIGFAGVFEPSVTVIVDTKTDTVYVIGAGSLADGGIAAALRRPNRMTSAASSNADAKSNGNNGHGHGGDE